MFDLNSYSDKLSIQPFTTRSGRYKKINILGCNYLSHQNKCVFYRKKLLFNMFNKSIF